MEKIFKTNTGVILYQDLDHSFVSSNPAEVLASLFEDLKNEDDIDGALNAAVLLLEINKQHGIYCNQEEKPVRVLSEKRGIFIAIGSNKALTGISSATAFDLEVLKKLEYPIVVNMLIPGP